MSKGNRGLEEITDVLSRRNWRLYETEEGKKTNRRTLYERSVEELEAKSKPLKLKTGKGAEKPRKLLEQVVSLQRHLDRRFAACIFAFGRAGILKCQACIPQEARKTFPSLFSLVSGLQAGASLRSAALLSAQYRFFCRRGPLPHR